MAMPKELLFIVFLWTSNAKVFHDNRNQIMTPNNGQAGNTPLSQGNFNEIAMFPSPSSNNLAPDNGNGTSISAEMSQPQITATVPTSVSSLMTPNLRSGTDTPATIVETVTSFGGTVIRVEFPSSINIFVNITNNGQSSNPTIVVPSTIDTVETPTAKGAGDTSTADSTTVEVSTISSTVEISTVESTSEVSESNSEMSTSATESPISIDSTTVIDSTVELSTVENISTTVELSTDSTSEISTSVDNAQILPTDTTAEIPTEDSTVVTSPGDSTGEVTTENTTVEISTVDNTSQGSTEIAPNTESMTETSTVGIVVEVLTENNTNYESSSLAVSAFNESSTEAMRNIQININLSDNTLNGNFGSTTRPSQSTVGNLGQLQDKMVFRRKCDEYYSTSRTGREAKVQVFIVGGTNSMPKEFPHMAALGYGNDLKKEWLCGGSLISENFVITAAHCILSKTFGVVQIVRLGTTILNTQTLDSQDYKVIKRISHPNYNTNEQYNDIALLQLDRPVKFSEYISPICLYSSNQINREVIATGWGKTEAAGEVSPELQKVELEVFTNKECQDSYSTVSKQDLPRGIVAETQICAGSRSEMKDTCLGDSGGPLQIEENDRMYLVGITSFGIGCGKPGRPGVYTNVSHYIPWIENIVWGSGR